MKPTTINPLPTTYPLRPDNEDEAPAVAALVRAAGQICRAHNKALIRGQR